MHDQLATRLEDPTEDRPAPRPWRADRHLRPRNRRQLHRPHAAPASPTSPACSMPSTVIGRHAAQVAIALRGARARPAGSQSRSARNVGCSRWRVRRRRSCGRCRPTTAPQQATWLRRRSGFVEESACASHEGWVVVGRSSQADHRGERTGATRSISGRAGTPT